jgi:putative phosphoesterase
MRIAVIADTHNKLPEHLVEALASADEIWHLGDVTSEDVINRVRSLGKPVRVIRGNCDSYEHWPERLRLERGGRTFLLIHAPPRKPAGAEFLLHGHTHVPRDEMVDGIRLLNPGTVGKPNRGAPPSWAWLTIGEDGEVGWEVVRL